ncbi:MAG: putative DNA binding domain-containing protein [Propionibacteriaceae bacterium]|jgi:ATP-dependent DNA helicase RecG|nr:putative DNA binding domain-containing protein [Propionibacteriaceae bacterium]
MTWDSPTVLTLIEDMRVHGGDFTSVEVKRGSGGCPDLATTLCAFGNMPDGGVIVIGLDENDGFAPVGVADPASIEQGIASQARTAVVPPVAVSFDTVPVAGEVVVVATVAGMPASDRPGRVNGRGYLRQADGDYAMSPQEEQQMLALRDRPRYDAVVVDGTGAVDLDEGLVQAFLRNARAASRRLALVDDQTVLRRKGVLEAEGPRLTLGGLYALGQYPQQFAPNLAVTAAVVPGLGSADRLVDLAHLDGPIPDLLDGCLEWLRRNLRTGVRVGADGQNYDHPELPLAALRELVANALVHRDLGPHTQSKRVEIRLRDDRLVISNPGGLWGVSRQQLGLPGGKSAVNEYLYDICSLTQTSQGARVIEGEGGGIGEAQRALADWRVEPPIFIDKAVSFTAVLMRPPSATAAVRSAATEPGDWMDVSRRILVALTEGPLDRRTMVERCHSTPTQIRYALNKLIKQGRVTMNGARGSRNTTYSLPVTKVQVARG